MGLRVKPEDDEKVKPEDYGGAQNKIDRRASLAKTDFRRCETFRSRQSLF